MVPPGSDIIISWIYLGFTTDLLGIWNLFELIAIYVDLAGFISTLEHL